MPIDHPIAQLPTDLSLEDAVEEVYGEDLNWLTDKLRRGVSCLVECDKQLVTFLYAALRGRLRDSSTGTVLRCRFVSGQMQQDGEQQGPQPSLLQLMIRQIAELVREVVHPEAAIIFDTTKPDGMPRKVLDVGKLHDLGWKHRIDLRDGIESTYRWFLETDPSEIRGASPAVA